MVYNTKFNLNSLLRDTTKKEDSGLFKINKKEFRKCMTDPQYFMNNYCYIQNTEKGTIKFHLHDFQCDMIDRFEEHRFNAVLKGRQEGLSTLIAAYLLWNMIFKPGYQALVMANRWQTSKNVISKIRFSIMQLEKAQKKKQCPNVLPWRWNKFIKRNVTEICMPNNSSVLSESCTDSPGRSSTVHCLVLDEAAVIPDLADKWGALFPIVTTGGKVIINSTPKGSTGFFYTICTNATLDQKLVNKHKIKPTCSTTGTNSYNLSILPYYIFPGRDIKWLDNICKDNDIGPRERAEEYECSFLASGETFIPPDKIQQLSDITEEPIKKVGPGGNVWIWHEPNPECQYLLCSDVAEGLGGDFSAFHILELETRRVVAEFKGHIYTHEYSLLIEEWANIYNKAGVIVERTGPGIAVLDNLVNTIQYEKIYYTPISDKLKNIKKDSKDRDRQPIQYFYNPRLNKYIQGKPGFDTKQDSRFQALNRMSSCVDSDKIQSRSIRLVDEFKSFVYNAKKQKFEADSGAHDDLVMSFAILCYIYEIAIQEFKLNQEYTTTMLKASSKGKKILPDHLGSHDLRSDRPFGVPNANTPTVADKLKQMKRNYRQQHKKYVGGQMIDLEKEFGF